MKRSFWFWGGLGAGLVFAASGCGGSHKSSGTVSNYSATDLGVLTSGASSRAAGINTSGDVVGSADDGRGNSRAFVYRNSAIQDINRLAGATVPSGETLSAAAAINDSGTVVGTATVSGSGAIHAFAFTGSTAVDLGTFSGGSNSAASGINATGVVVGGGDNSAGTTFAFSSPAASGGALANLGSFSGGGASQANAINAGGYVVGRALSSNGITYASSFYQGAITNLGGSSGTENSEARAVNVNGVAAGYFFMSGGRLRHAALFAGTTEKDLGTLSGGSNSLASGINDSSQTVGNGDISGGATHAILYSNNHLYDLNDLVQTSLNGYTLTDAAAINNAGWIAATGTNTVGITHAFLLKPSAF